MGEAWPPQLNTTIVTTPEGYTVLRAALTLMAARANPLALTSPDVATAVVDALRQLPVPARPLLDAANEAERLLAAGEEAKAAEKITHAIDETLAALASLNPPILYAPPGRHHRIADNIFLAILEPATLDHVLAELEPDVENLATLYPDKPHKVAEWVLEETTITTQNTPQTTGAEQAIMFTIRDGRKEPIRLLPT